MLVSGDAVIAAARDLGVKHSVAIRLWEKLVTGSEALILGEVGENMVTGGEASVATAANANGQMTREQANKLFSDGEIGPAARAYEKLVANAENDDAKLVLLSNLGLCHIKLKQPVAAVAALEEALGLTRACYAAPRLATKVSARLLEAQEEAAGHLSDADAAVSRRAAVAEARFYSGYPGGHVKGLRLPPVRSHAKRSRLPRPAAACARVGQHPSPVTTVGRTTSICLLSAVW